MYSPPPTPSAVVSLYPLPADIRVSAAAPRAPPSFRTLKRASDATARASVVWRVPRADEPSGAAASVPTEPGGAAVHRRRAPRNALLRAVPLALALIAAARYRLAISGAFGRAARALAAAANQAWVSPRARARALVAFGVAVVAPSVF